MESASFKAVWDHSEANSIFVPQRPGTHISLDETDGSVVQTRATDDVVRERELGQGAQQTSPNVPPEAGHFALSPRRRFLMYGEAVEDETCIQRQDRPARTTCQLRPHFGASRKA